MHELYSTAPVAFYDAWERRLLADYVRGNPRAEEAIGFAISCMPAGSVRILDVGCGIGWSSFEIARHLPDAVVLGLDLSPRLVRTARTLFGDVSNLAFDARDFTLDAIVAECYDAIVLLDVYEHFPADARPAVHARLAALLKSDGRLIATTPTVAHQDFLRAHHPDRLQPVDEDVAAEDIERLARDVGGSVAVCHPISIWDEADYLHSLVVRGAERTRGEPRPEPLTDRVERARRVEQRLGLRWTESAGFVAARGATRVGIAQAWPLSETFVREHVENLPADVHVLRTDCGRTEDGSSVLPRPVARGARLLARLLRRSPSGAEDAIFHRLPARARAPLYRRYLIDAGIEVILAEYGHAAADLHAACTSARVPIVAHYHGFDAFRADVLARHATAYHELFAERWPVVAVSDSMKRQLIGLGASPAQVRVIRYGIDLDLFRPGEPSPGLVVMVGRLVGKKAPQLAVKAFARAASRVPDAALVIVGDGPLRPELERTIAELDLSDRVRLEGARDHEWVAQLLARAAVFLQHSIVDDNGDREGTPVAILEAGAAAVPVVATRHEGIAEVVRDGETGLLVDEGDVDAMGEALSELLLDPRKARALGLAARAEIERVAAREGSLDELWSVLEQALADARASAP